MKTAALTDYEQDIINGITETFNDTSGNTAEKYDAVRELIHEIVDGCCPAYTEEIQRLAFENRIISNREVDLIAFDGKITPVNVAAGAIFEHLCEIAYQTLDSLESEAEVEND